MIPFITRHEDTKRYNGQKVWVVGRYEQINVNKRPNARPIYGSYVCIWLEDGYVLLETHEKAIRATDEIERFKGQQVEVKGQLCAHCLLWGDGREASITGACVKEVEKIRERLDIRG